jgi:hypothetical protein
MRGPASLSATQDLGRHGAWRFTRQYVVEPELIAVFHRLYEAAFGPLRTRAMARQVLTEEEFRGLMVNSEVLKYVAWSADGKPVGLAALTRSLATVPWISPEYFAARYPEQWARGAVWYFDFVLAHPSQRHARFTDQIIEVAVGELLAERAICAYDICAFNDYELGFGSRLADSFERTTGVRPERRDVQNYYALDFGLSPKL